ncbi:MAG: hypothetical protein SOR38_00150 [Oscillospiraceae bacterium]|nr:hypothetical protein [Oscillospiraceae bacterium]MDY3064203.1 hypothetical protein [Oscillospiraceae bacterium]
MNVDQIIISCGFEDSQKPMVEKILVAAEGCKGRDDFCRLVFSNNGKVVGKHMFLALRSIATKINSVSGIGYDISDIRRENMLLSHSDYAYLFSSTQEIIDTISTISKEDIYMMSMCCAVWYGAEIKDLIQMQTVDLNVKNQTLRIGNEIVQIDINTLQVMQLHLQNLYPQNISESAYLFPGRGGSASTAPALKNRISRINRLLDNKKISIREIRNCGMFRRSIDENGVSLTRFNIKHSNRNTLDRDGILAKFDLFVEYLGE